MKKTGQILLRTGQLYTQTKIPRAAAALSYYLTTTLFPLVICLYTLLGSNYARAIRVVEFAEQFLSSETVRNLRTFLTYVSTHYSTAMLVAGITVVLTSASAALRSLQATIGEMQGGQRFQGLMDLIFSVILSLVFVAAMYLALLVMLTGKDFIELVNGFLPFVDISNSWRYIRYLLMAGIEFLLFWALYCVSRRRADHYACWPGAVFSMVGMVLMSLLFSMFIAVSARYPLVYGSLASLILLMFWLFLSCQVIYLGAALNIAIRDAGSTPPRASGLESAGSREESGAEAGKKEKNT